MITQIHCYSSGIAGRDPRAKEGPRQLINHLEKNSTSLFQPIDLITSSNLSGRAALTETHAINSKLADLTFRCIEKQRHFLTLSGDHSSAIGTWSGAFNALYHQQKTGGLIWIDAHMDSHTFETSLSNNIHGMPLATLLGHGDPLLTGIANPTPALLPENVILIGIRSYEPEEKALLESLNVKIYYMTEVKQRGFHDILQEALITLDQRVDKIGVTIDIDAVDPTDAPAVSTPEENGIPGTDLIEAIKLIHQHPKWFGSEITEFLPYKDIDNKTENLTMALLEGLLHAMEKA